MKRNNYSADNFIRDEAFQQWVFSPTPEKDLFWQTFLQENPHQREAVEEARRFLQVFTTHNASILESRIGLLKKKIDMAIDGVPAAKPEETRFTGKVVRDLPLKRGRSVYRMTMAACVVLLIAASVLLVRDPMQWIPFADVQHQVTQKGNRSVITLEDGTKVWLNADSRLEYPRSFDGKARREVYLEGEAFFDVSKNEQQPFIVHTSDINIIVVGTSFNVKSYQDQKNIETTLVEGKITVEERTGEAKRMAVLPNQQAVYKKKTSELILQQDVNTEKHTGWKEGNLNFENVALEEIIPSLERWYNVTIHLENNNSLSCRFSAKIENNTLEEVLELFRASDGIAYEIKGKDVYIRGQWCQE